MIESRAVIIGDSTNNTLSVVRSLGEANIEQILILKGTEDICFVTKSKYLKGAQVYRIETIDQCLPILKLLKSQTDKRQYVICTFDEAAVYIDGQEANLYPDFQTPARGKKIGALFNKDEQCRLAEKCGLTVPKSVVFRRSDNIDQYHLDYPVLLKPLNSTKGEKGDIHICPNLKAIEDALSVESHCTAFILQEFIDKDFEIDCIGVRTDNEMIIAGGVHKIRHYPPLIGAGAFGLFKPIEEYHINLQGLEDFLRQANYYGPFSVEFLHKGEKDYFMEVNFRNEGLAYAATAAGANLHALYINQNKELYLKKVRRIYMMNYSLDFLYVKNGDVSMCSWLKDFLRTGCFINFNRRDLMPTIIYYKNKLRKNETNNQSDFTRLQC